MTIGEQGNYDLEGRDPVDLMDFKVTAEGKTVEQGRDQGDAVRRRRDRRAETL